MSLLLIQFVVPCLLLLLVALRTRSRATKALQAAAVFAYLLALHIAGLWLDLPWWTPWVYWVLFLAALLVGKEPKQARPAAARPGWLVPAFWALATLGFVSLAMTAVLGRVAPSGPVVAIASPLPPGRYLVVNGGNSSLVNAHFETLDPKTPRQAAHRGQSYGVDIVGLTSFGRTSDGWQPRDPERYAIFGTPVVAPCSGRVVQQLDGRPDMPVPVADTTVMSGNHVLLQCGDVHVLLAHMRRGSVAVREGQPVRTGQKLGEVGNSGNTGAPHLHVHAQRPGKAEAPFDADPLPIRIDGRYLARGDRL